MTKIIICLIDLLFTVNIVKIVRIWIKSTLIRTLLAITTLRQVVVPRCPTLHVRAIIQILLVVRPLRQLVTAYLDWMAINAAREKACTILFPLYWL